MPERCPIYQCEHPAVVQVEWGSTPQRAGFCQVHADELWEKSRAAVGAGLMHYRLMPVGDTHE